jgi:hypothetical protein
MAVLTHFTAKHNGKRSYAIEVARSLKIRILPNAEQKSFKQYADEIPSQPSEGTG